MATIPAALQGQALARNTQKTNGKYSQSSAVWPLVENGERTNCLNCWIDWILTVLLDKYRALPAVVYSSQRQVDFICFANTVISD